MPRVSLSPQAFGYMDRIGISGENRVRPSGRTACAVVELTDHSAVIRYGGATPTP